MASLLLLDWTEVDSEVEAGVLCSHLGGGKLGQKSLANVVNSAQS